MIANIDTNTVVTNTTVQRFIAYSFFISLAVFFHLQEILLSILVLFFILMIFIICDFEQISRALTLKMDIKYKTEYKRIFT